MKKYFYTFGPICGSKFKKAMTVIQSSINLTSEKLALNDLANGPVVIDSRVQYGSDIRWPTTYFLSLVHAELNWFMMWPIYLRSYD